MRIDVNESQSQWGNVTINGSPAYLQNMEVSHSIGYSGPVYRLTLTIISDQIPQMYADDAPRPQSSSGGNGGNNTERRIDIGEL